MSASEGAECMAASALRFGNASVGSEWATFVLLCTNRLRKQSSCPARHPFLARVQTAWPSLGSTLETPWLAVSGPLLSSYA